MTDHYAVFGNPISHSKSPDIHRAFAAATGQDMAYGMIEPPVDGFEQALADFIAQGGRGCNITVPFKLDAFAAATERRPSAEQAGASNCLKVEADRIIAENFDGIGLVRDLQDNHAANLAGKRVLLLGAGGATRGVVVPILQTGAASVTIANRSVDKAIELAMLFGDEGNVQGCGYGDLTGPPFDIVINGTSASLTAQRLPLPPQVFAAGCLAYEMVYGKGMTPFLLQAKEAGTTRIADGVGMLVEQAAEAFAWWRGVRPVTAPVIADLTVPLT